MSEKVPRIPLAERLEKEKRQNPDFLKVFYLFMDDYFIGMSKISRDLYYARRYKSLVGEPDEEPRLLADCIHSAGGLPDEERNSLLYYTLVEPFANIATFETERS